MYVRTSTVFQEAFIAAWIALGESYDVERDRLADELKAVKETRPRSLDMVWLLRKRAATVSLKKALAARTVLQDVALVDLLASSQAIEADFQEWQLELPWCDWAVDALERAMRVRRVLEERARGIAMAAEESRAPGAPSSTAASWPAAASSPTASSHAPASRPTASSHALVKYQTYFCKAAGRDPKDGAPGIGCYQPPCPVNFHTMDDLEWARWWLQLGGFSSAEQLDVDGWTPLHHAVQSTIHWDMGHHVVRGLIPMMGQNWLRAKTEGGRPWSWTALHMLCNGSDCMFQRGELASLLITADAEVDVETAEGRTPFMMAAGTGVVHQAEALSQAGCNVHATCWLGRNAADRALKSSSMMGRYPCLLIITSVWITWATI